MTQDAGMHLIRTPISLQPFINYYGSKYLLARRYPPPLHRFIIEPFGGSAGYSLRYHAHQVLLHDLYPAVIDAWSFYQRASGEDILAWPDITRPGFELSQCTELDTSERAALGFWLAKAVTSPRRKATPWVQADLDWPKTKERIASQLRFIRHWQIACASYETAPNIEATWFIDPPYQLRGQHYVFGSDQIDYSALQEWVHSRPGQVIVCESEGANWLKGFQYLTLGRYSAKTKQEGLAERFWYREARPRLVAVGERLSTTAANTEPEATESPLTAAIKQALRRAVALSVDDIFKELARTGECPPRTTIVKTLSEETDESGAKVFERVPDDANNWRLTAAEPGPQEDLTVQIRKVLGTKAMTVDVILAELQMRGYSFRTSTPRTFIASQLDYKTEVIVDKDGHSTRRACFVRIDSQPPLYHSADCEPIAETALLRKRGFELEPPPTAALRPIDSNSSYNALIANRILTWACGSCPSRVFSKRDLQKANRGFFPVGNNFDGPLRLLTDHGYIEPLPMPHQQRGRPPSPSYRLHPDAIAPTPTLPPAVTPSDAVPSSLKDRMLHVLGTRAMSMADLAREMSRQGLLPPKANLYQVRTQSFTRFYDADGTVLRAPSFIHVEDGMYRAATRADAVEMRRPTEITRAPLQQPQVVSGFLEVVVNGITIRGNSQEVAALVYKLNGEAKALEEKPAPPPPEPPPPQRSLTETEGLVMMKWPEDPARARFIELSWNDPNTPNHVCKREVPITSEAEGRAAAEDLNARLSREEKKGRRRPAVRVAERIPDEQLSPQLTPQDVLPPSQDALMPPPRPEIAAIRRALASLTPQALNKPQERKAILSTCLDAAPLLASLGAEVLGKEFRLDPAVVSKTLRRKQPAHVQTLEERRKVFDTLMQGAEWQGRVLRDDPADRYLRELGRKLGVQHNTAKKWCEQYRAGLFTTSTAKHTHLPRFFPWRGEGVPKGEQIWVSVDDQFEITLSGGKYRLTRNWKPLGSFASMDEARLAAKDTKQSQAPVKLFIAWNRNLGNDWVTSAKVSEALQQSVGLGAAFEYAGIPTELHKNPIALGKALYKLHESGRFNGWGLSRKVGREKAALWKVDRLKAP